MVAILHNIRSAHNVGSIFRTADAANIDKIYLSGITPGPTDELGRSRQDIAKTALGAEKNVLFEKTASISRLINKLKSEGWQIIAIEQSDASLPYYRFKARNFRKIALIVGNEVRGISKTILKKCDKVLEIPMRGKMARQAAHPRHTGRGKESLNVAVAFGIVVFGIKRP